MKKVLKLLAVIFFILLSTMVAGQTVGFVENDQELIQGPTKIIIDFVNIATQNHCFCANETIAKSGKNNILNFEATVFVPSIKALYALLKELTIQWSIKIQKLILGPSIPGSKYPDCGKVDLQLELFPASATTIADKSIFDILNPLINLDIFSPTLPATYLKMPMIFGLHYEKDKDVLYRILFDRLDDLEMATKSLGLPTGAKTISLNTFPGGEAYCVDFISNNRMNISKAVEICKKISEHGKLLEFSAEKELYGELLSIIRIEIAVQQLKWFLETLKEEIKFSIDNFEISGRPNSLDKIILQVAGKFGEKTQTLPLTIIEPFLNSQWFAEMGDKYRIYGTSLRIYIDFALPASRIVEETSLFHSLESLLNSAGFFPKSRLTRENSEIGEAEVCFQFIHTVGSNINTANNAKYVTDFIKKYDLIEATEINGSFKFRVQIPFAEIPVLLNILAPKENLCLSEFVLTCRYPQSAEVAFTLSNASSAYAGKQFHEFVCKLVGPTFPWYKPEQELKQTLIIDHIALNSNGDLVVKGLTLKSGLIFSKLFPSLEKLYPNLNPYFTKGQYTDHHLGRLMSFEVTGHGPAVSK